MQDLEQNIDVSNYCNRLVVLGAKLKVKDGEGNEADTEERLTIESVNNGLKYIDDKESIAKYGVIQGQVIYDDVTEAKNLLSKGQKYLLNQRLLVSNKVNALDLSLIGIDLDSFEVGNYYPLIHEILNINDTVRVVEKSISIENPHANTITLGDLEKDIKKYNIQTKKGYSEAIKKAEEANNRAITVEKFATDEIYRVDGNINNIITDVGNEITNINSSLGNASTDINSINTSISLLEAKVNKNTTDINSMTDDISLIKADTSTIKTDISTLKTNISKIKEDISSINKNIEAILELLEPNE